MLPGDKICRCEIFFLKFHNNAQSAIENHQGQERDKLNLSIVYIPPSRGNTSAFFVSLSNLFERKHNDKLHFVLILFSIISCYFTIIALMMRWPERWFSSVISSSRWKKISWRRCLRRGCLVLVRRCGLVRLCGDLRPLARARGGGLRRVYGQRRDVRKIRVGCRLQVLARYVS